MIQTRNLTVWLYSRLKLEASRGMNSYKLSTLSTICIVGLWIIVWKRVDIFDVYLFKIPREWTVYKDITMRIGLFMWDIAHNFPGIWQEFGEIQRETSSNFGRRKWLQSMSYPPWRIHDKAILYLMTVRFNQTLKMEVTPHKSGPLFSSLVLVLLACEYIASLALFFITT